jgi:hypothetical protein
LPSFGSSNPQSQAASVPPPPNASVAPAGQQAYAPPLSQPAAPATPAPAAHQDYSDLMPYPSSRSPTCSAIRRRRAEHVHAIGSALYAARAGGRRHRRGSGAAGKSRYVEPAGLSQAIAVRSHVEQIRETRAAFCAGATYNKDARILMPYASGNFPDTNTYMV